MEATAQDARDQVQPLDWYFLAILAVGVVTLWIWPVNAGRKPCRNRLLKPVHLRTLLPVP